ncbi:hypothetical protein Kpol_1060p42 [Vanderwaltozyma polyspora DSM 70294]|uniref:Crh-like protein n=1 Tax=Vanderwaltozyma polyspora (strain ATCC 22028 / DSM 70294 / BCRC 21397 / CBS 2163 / NBRC 10782 / NRRL Y-8283 / UCD 57-17) TaxID=436907 RepID=A7TK40_VANPO|nr:uncharacterized protein Kpol_1060p42 [Vanderwaltozyma polyspora DSM 70294]EDO17386.1 hypothetical protein Kpol_1060p42 [Vanderwaltozyma polyspora DSM 70294]
MLFNKKSLFAALVAMKLAAADTCNPLKSTSCPDDTALGTSFSEDFTSASKYFTNTGNPGTIEYASDGLAITMKKRFDNPSLKSNFYLMYGKFEVIMKAAPGTGIVSSVFLQSDDLDEIDLEWLGGDTTQFQSNYFSKGNTTTYDRGEYHGVNAPQNEFHNYTVDWAMDKTVFYLDGVPVRTLLNTTSEGYPQSPMALYLGVWAGGDPSNPPGTIEWAGGETNYADAPFSMFVKQLVVSDYSSGSSYSYNGQSGSWESIQAANGQVYGRYGIAQEEFANLVDGESVEYANTASNSTTTTTTSATTSSETSETSEDVSTSTEFSSSSSELKTLSTSSDISETSTFSSLYPTSNSSTIEPSSTEYSSSSLFFNSTSSAPVTTSASSTSEVQTTIMSSRISSSTVARNTSSTTTHEISSANFGNAVIEKSNSLFTVLGLALAFFM